MEDNQEANIVVDRPRWVIYIISFGFQKCLQIFQILKTTFSTLVVNYVVGNNGQK